jgi:hypothetical protein
MEAVFSFREAVGNGARSDQIHVPSWFMEHQRIDGIWGSDHVGQKKRKEEEEKGDEHDCLHA